MTKKTNMVEIIRREKLFYDIADAKLICKDGNELKVNKAILAFHIKEFQEIFYDSKGKPREISVITINEAGAELFKLFLDCVLGFKEMQVEDVLQIYGLVLKYDLSDLKAECAKVLTPKGMTDNTPKVLKLSLSYDDHIDLRNACLRAMVAYGLKNIFNQEKYYDIIDPKCALLLLEEDKSFDKDVVLGLLKWGAYWMRRTDPNLTIREYFEKNGVFDKLTAIYHEYDDPTDFIEFYKTGPLKNMYTEEEIFAYSGKMWKNLRKKKQV